MPAPIEGEKGEGIGNKFADHAPRAAGGEKGASKRPFAGSMPPAAPGRRLKTSVDPRCSNFSYNSFDRIAAIILTSM